MQCPVHFRLTTFIAALMLMLVIAEPAFATPRQQKRDFKQQVEALEEKWRQTQLANDVSAMDRMLSDDYIGISMTGQVYTKTQQLERMRTKKFSLTQIKFDERKVKLIGSIAIVTSRADIEGVSDEMPVKGTFRYTRVYRRTPSGGWKITSFEATRVPRSRGSSDEQPARKAVPRHDPGPGFDLVPTRSQSVEKLSSPTQTSQTVGPVKRTYFGRAAFRAIKRKYRVMQVR